MVELRRAVSRPLEPPREAATGHGLPARNVPSAAAGPRAQKQAPAATGPGSPSAVVAAASEAASGELAEESVSQYRLAVARQARQFRHYPEALQAQGMAGEVVVGVVAAVGDGGPHVRLERSSGHARLDEAVVAMIAQAVRLTPWPSEWQRRPVRATVPVHVSRLD
ncbi:MAG TPA: TonB family protein [Azonexus sp.]